MELRHWTTGMHYLGGGKEKLFLSESCYGFEDLGTDLVCSGQAELIYCFSQSEAQVFPVIPTDQDCVHFLLVSRGS